MQRTVRHARGSARLSRAASVRSAAERHDPNREHGGAKPYPRFTRPLALTPAAAIRQAVRDGCAGDQPHRVPKSEPGRGLREFYQRLLDAETVEGAHHPLRVGGTLLVFFEADGAVGQDELAFDCGPVEHTRWSKGSTSKTRTGVRSRSPTTTAPSIGRSDSDAPEAARLARRFPDQAVACVAISWNLRHPDGGGEWFLGGCASRRWRSPGRCARCPPGCTRVKYLWLV
jgi:hypothetical protein